MTDKNDLDVKSGKLQELFKENEAAKVILSHFATRQRNGPTTKLEPLMRVLSEKLGEKQISNGAVIQVFRSLEEIGCGRFIVGRKGHPTRFKWSDSLITVGKAALGEASKIESLD